MGEALKALTGLSATIFSPAKMIYIAYVALTFTGKLQGQPCWVFPTVSAFFLVAEIFHNDWLRIRLNNNAEGNRPQFLRPK
jgi:hypothetical protein